MVNDAEDKVLDLGICEIEHHLCAATSLLQLTPLGLQHPVGMLLVELAGGVGHLRLYPDAELYFTLFGSIGERLDAVGQLVLVDHPVAQ